MKLIVGLGNPGPDYRRTRHNAGFMAVDRLADRHATGQTPRARFSGVTVEARIETGQGACPCLLVKPTTFMNLSGRCVAEALRFYKLDPVNDLLVLVDDVALPAGKIRLRARGSAGGHNGLADIERLLGTDEYGRCRIGFDPPGRIPQKDYVLGRFTEEQEAALQPALERACDAAETWAVQGITAAMNRFNAEPETGDKPRPDSSAADAASSSDHVSNGAGADSGAQ